jgi:hypothetical protein
LSELLREGGHEKSNNLIMKMDIESAEWDVFDETPSVVINQFSQIVLELHGLIPDRKEEGPSLILKVLEKINETHQCIHVHANTYDGILWVGDNVLPDLIEVTYVRREDVHDRLIKNKRRFPTKLDYPTFEGLPDLKLGTFRLIEFL